MLVITGYHSQISQELRYIAQLERGQESLRWDDSLDLSLHNHYFFCGGVLSGQPIEQLSDSEIALMLDVNFVSVAQRCERILHSNAYARICVMGSESGITGSFDKVYAASKAALHEYVETRRVKPNQQLVGIAPSIIEDAGMTRRRKDAGNLERRKEQHPKQRFLKSVEVARLADFLLYEDQGYICNTVIRMNGGMFAR